MNQYITKFLMVRSIGKYILKFLAIYSFVMVVLDQFILAASIFSSECL